MLKKIDTYYVTHESDSGYSSVIVWERGNHIMINPKMIVKFDQIQDGIGKLWLYGDTYQDTVNVRQIDLEKISKNR